MRYTKLVATVGPATSSYEMLKKLSKKGMDVARLNFSHGSHSSQLESVKIIQKLNKEGHKIAILLDTKGPQIRTGDVAKPITIRKGQSVMFRAHKKASDKNTVIEVSYDAFPRDAKKAKTILLDNGEMEFQIEKVGKDYVQAKALGSGSIGSRRHINIPGADVSLPSFTKKDWADIAFGVQHNVEFIAASFIRNAKDIKQIKAFLAKKKSDAHVIAKIETVQAVEDIDNIIAVSDGVMVARGDLGAEIPFELVPGVQDEIVMKCRAAGKPVIVATHMLESMIENPMPTRAELTDIAHAAATRADATMLSGETAAGKYPVKCVEAMRRVLSSTEEHYAKVIDSYLTIDTSEAGTLRNEQARAACMLARKINAKAIIVITKKGRTARAVSKFRSTVPVLAFTNSELVKHQLLLAWGVSPFAITLAKNPERTVSDALKRAVKEKKVRKGDQVIVVSDILDTAFGTSKQKNHAMTVQIRTVN